MKNLVVLTGAGMSAEGDGINYVSYFGRALGQYPVEQVATLKDILPIQSCWLMNAESNCLVKPNRGMNF